ncbi:uncharacterized protein LOC143286135 [Babylonia areolata]|uniref:uncharacterized protein LOC143286135 n=1 Tax=Babylonia areolata TaxID=304850 RepID=UPI003FD2648F
MYSMDLSKPMQCSDGLPKGQPPSFPTGRVVSAPDVQLDAEIMKPAVTAERPSAKKSPPAGASAAAEYNVPPTSQPQHTIELSGKSGGKMLIENIVSVMEPNTTFRMANETHTTVYHGPKQERPAKIKNRYQLTESRAEPMIQHLDVISAGLTTDWKTLGRHLRLDNALLDQINIDYQVEGQHEVNYRMLAKWKEVKGPVTLHMLARALADIGRGDLADELRKG